MAIPEALTTYLDALIAGDHQKAYDRTGLRALADTSDEAATLSYPHFRAFHLGDPLESYAVSDVTRLDRRTVETVGQAGTPYFVVDITLRQRSGTVDTTMSVDGQVLGVVEVDPIPVRVRVPAGEVLVDGVVAPGRAAGLRTMLLLAGAHSISVADRNVRFTTSPLTVASGTATVDDGVLVLD